MEELMELSQAALVSAEVCEGSGDRFDQALLAALRAATAVLAVRARRGGTGPGRDVWRLLPQLMPELSEWSAYFAVAATKRRAAVEGAYQVTAREADDLLRDAQAFHGEVARRLHVEPARDRGAG